LPTDVGFTLFAQFTTNIAKPAHSKNKDLFFTETLLFSIEKNHISQNSIVFFYKLQVDQEPVAA
jgi:hypothetical protein